MLRAALAAGHEKRLAATVESQEYVDECERLGSAIVDTKRHYGHLAINNSTSTLGLFRDMILSDKAR